MAPSIEVIKRHLGQYYMDRLYTPYWYKWAEYIVFAFYLRGLANVRGRLNCLSRLYMLGSNHCWPRLICFPWKRMWWHCTGIFLQPLINQLIWIYTNKMQPLSLINIIEAYHKYLMEQDGKAYDLLLLLLTKTMKWAMIVPPPQIYYRSNWEGWRVILFNLSKYSKAPIVLM